MKISKLLNIRMVGNDIENPMRNTTWQLVDGVWML